MQDLLGYPALWAHLRAHDMERFADRLQSICRESLSASKHADFARWESAVNALTVPHDMEPDLSARCVAAHETTVWPIRLANAVIEPRSNN